uniref:T6SS immunity protein Tdi1 domain-containing protein n=1 Tax=Chryseobacterium sp. TaxID=1871047 RepID=UPI003219A5C9
DSLIEIWKKYGFSGLSDGLIWLTNPDEYTEIIEEWKKVNNIIELPDQKIYVIARGAFGNLLFFIIKDDGETYFSTFDVLYNKYKIPVKDTELFIDVILDDKSFVRTYFLKELFDLCLEKFGKLNKNEVYGFNPLPVLGGDASLEYAEKMPFWEYETLCAQSQG